MGVTAGLACTAATTADEGTEDVCTWRSSCSLSSREVVYRVATPGSVGVVERSKERGSPGAQDHTVLWASSGVSQSGLRQFHPHLHMHATHGCHLYCATAVPCNYTVAGFKFRYLAVQGL